MLLSRLTSRVQSCRFLSGASRPASNWSQLSSVLSRGAPLDIHPEVQDALATNKPVVALETALVTHGFPYPENLELSMSLEEIVRSTGSIPATIGVIEGRIKIGMKKAEFERLSDKRNSPPKISRRDIAPAIAMKADGGTTCSATLIFAALAGIKVFATGGLGGVHRGGENSMDISADLGELTRCPVGLVSSGVKSILDIRRSLEYLETLGVPVITYGTTREFPAFFSRHSGCDSPWNLNDPMTAAKLLHAQWQLGMDNGALIAVPIPEEHEEQGMIIQKAVDQAVAESEEAGISKRGNDVTPWLLARIAELTGGTSLSSNIVLLKNTARIGGEIAVQYQKLAHGLAYLPHSPSAVDGLSLSRPDQDQITLSPANLMVVGSAAIDITAQAKPKTDNTLAVHSTAPGNISMSLGGVARNIAEASHRVITSQSPELSTLLVSPIGEDAFGRVMEEETRKIGMRLDGFIKGDKRTAVCNMILDGNGDLIGGVADMDITSALEGDSIIRYIQEQRPRILALDGNLSPDAINSVVHHCVKNDIAVFFEPTSVTKSTAILPSIAALFGTAGKSVSPITFSSPNLLELVQLDQAASAEPYNLSSHPMWWKVIDSLSLGSQFRMDLEQLAKKNASDFDSSRGTLAFLVNEGVAQMAIKLLPFFQHLIVKCGARGVLVIMRLPKDPDTTQWRHKHSDKGRCVIEHRGEETIILQHFPAHPIDVTVNVTGAGDSFVGALLARLMQNPKTFQDPKSLSDAISFAQQAAVLSLQSHFAVSPLLSLLNK